MKYKLVGDLDHREVSWSPKYQAFMIHGLIDSTELKIRYDRFITEPIKKHSFSQKGVIYKLYSNLYFSKRNLISILVNKILPLPFDIKIQSILDVGCSSGDFLHFLPKKYKKMGVEINSLAVKIAREKGLDVWEGNFCNYSSNEKFDLIRSFHVIEHIQDIESFFQALKKHSNKYVILATPNANSLSRIIFGKYWDGFYDRTHFTIFTSSTIIKMANLYEYNIRRISTYPMGYMSSSFLKLLNLRHDQLFNLAFWFLFIVFLPIDFIICLFGKGDALYVELEKK